MQEIVVLAVLSKDPVFLDALHTGKDVHCLCAELLFGQDWVNATEDGCDFYKPGPDGLPQKKQCSCAGHKDFRNRVKTISFGLVYGMSEVGLAGRLGITNDEAVALTKSYFKTFPAIRHLLDSFAAYGMANGFIRTGGITNAKRYFPYWKGDATAKGLRGSIERASKNTPIQGLAAQQAKIACVLFREKSRVIGTNCMLVSQLHDEIFVQAHKSVADEAARILKECMEEAGKITLGCDLLKASPEITNRWMSDL